MCRITKIFIAFKTEDRSYRYYYPLEYDPILDTPVLIANRADVDRLVEALVMSDLLESEIKLCAALGRRAPTGSVHAFALSGSPKA